MRKIQGGPLPIRKRSFLLFELLVALTLVAVCLLPLIKPHASMRVKEKQQLEEMELERIAQAAFCHLKIGLYEHQLHSWEKLKDAEGILPKTFTSSFGKTYRCHYKIKEVGYCQKRNQHKDGRVLEIELSFPPYTEVFERTLYLERVAA